MAKKHTNTHIFFRKLLLGIASIMLVVFPREQSFSAEFSYFSSILREQNIIYRDFTSDNPIRRIDALSIAIGIGGWPIGCGYLNTLSCDIEMIARDRGLLFSRIENPDFTFLSRAKALKLILQARNIQPTEKPSGYSDVDGKISKSYVGYIARARELGCIQASLSFRPFDNISEGEFAKIANCTIQKTEQEFNAAPKDPESGGKYPSFLIDTNNPSSYGFIPSPSGSSSFALNTEFWGLQTVVNNLSILISSLTGSSHSPVTIGMSGGLSLSGQILSLGVANSTTIGALSPTDWNIFNNKIGLTALSVTGGFLTYNNISGIFGWSGSTTNITEGSNLYFTSSRAQDALSGTVNTLSGRIATNEFGIISLSGALNLTRSYLASATGSIFSLSNYLATATGNIFSLSGTVFNLSGVVSSLSGGLDITNTNLLSVSGALYNLSGVVNNLSGSLDATNTNLLTLSGRVDVLSGSLDLTNANLVLTNTNLLTLSGILDSLSGTVSSLSGRVLSVENSLTSLSGALDLTNSNLVLTNNYLATATGNILSLSNYLTSATGNILSLSNYLATATGDILTLSGRIDTLSGRVLTNETDILSISGTVFNLSGVVNLIGVDVTSLSGRVLSLENTTASLSGRVLTNEADILTLSGVVASKISLTSLSAIGGISYNNTTGEFSDLFSFNNGISRVGNSVGLTLGATGQVLTMSGGAPVWTSLAGGGITSLNGLGDASQTFAVGTAGTTFNISSVGGVHTFNIPYASNTATGLLTSSDWTVFNDKQGALQILTPTNGLSLVGTGLSLAIANATTTGALSSFDWNTFNNKVSYISGATNGLFISGSGISLSLASSVASGALSAGDWNIFNNKVSYISGATNGLLISGSGLSLALANATTTGALSSFDWNTFNNKVASINGMTGVTQTFAIGTTGNDFNITSSGNVHTFNIPDAGVFSRGLVSTGTQVFTGAKTFNGTITHSGATVMAAMTLGNYTVSGSIGTAATTVDIKTTLNLNQTGANITLTLPNPTDTSTGRILYINNVGTVGFTMLSQRVEAGQSRQAIWTGGNWRWIGDQGGESQVHIQKPGDEFVNNTNVPQNDDHLLFPIGANETWIGEILVDYTSPVAQDIRFAITAPAGATCVYSVMDYDEGTAGIANTACPTAIIMTTDSATDESALISFSVVNGGTAGNVTLQWAQGTAAVVNTTVHDGSYLHAYRVRGADYAEIYYTDDGSVSKGDIVSLTGNGVSQVVKSNKSYDSKAIGVISTKPGMVLGEVDGSGKAVIVGLAGRVPVKVSTHNGNILPGDYITPSDIPGVGMKATEPGRVIGKALTTYVGEEIGTVMVFIENSYYDGVNEAEYNEYISNAGNTTLSGGSLLSLPSGSLDRFSFMVKRSLGKIGSGNLNFGNSGSDIESLSGIFTQLQGTIDTHTAQIGNLENNLSDLSGSLETLRKGQEMLENKEQTPAVTNVTNNYIVTSTGSEEYIESTEEISSLEIITDVMEYITNLLKDSIKIIKEIVVLRIVALEAHFEQIFAKYAHIDVIDSEKITTKKLCIDGAGGKSCMTEDDLRNLLEKSAPKTAPTIPPHTEPTPSEGTVESPETGSNPVVPEVVESVVAPVETPVEGATLETPETTPEGAPAEVVAPNPSETVVETPTENVEATVENTTPEPAPTVILEAPAPSIESSGSGS